MGTVFFLSSSATMVKLFLFAFLVPSLAIDLQCDDCISLIDSFVDLSVADDSIVQQQAVITLEICPDADLGPPDAHPNCEKFTEHHWPDLARFVFPIFLNSTFICTDVVGSCFEPSKSFKALSEREIGCADCTQALDYMAGFFALPQTGQQMADFLAGTWCTSGVPEDDATFCVDYTQIVIPKALPMFAPTDTAQQEDICRKIAQVC